MAEFEQEVHTCLVCLTDDQPHTGLIISGAHDPSFRIQGARLGGGIQILEPMASFPVPETHRSIVTYGVKVSLNMPCG